MAKKRLYNSIPRNGLIGEFILDGNANDTNDGTKNNLTASNITWTNTNRGYQKQGASMNGSTSTLLLSSDLGLTGTAQPYTMSLWVKPTSNMSAQQVFINYSTSVKHIYSYMEFYSGAVRHVRVRGGLAADINTYTIAMNAGVWHHLCGTYDGTNIRLYIDGVLTDTDASSGDGNSGYSNLFSIGSLVDGTLKFNGITQGARIYNRAISQNEIQNLYQEGLRQLANGSDSILSSAIAYYDFNGDETNDIIGGYTLTKSGSSTIGLDNFGISRALINTSAYLYRTSPIIGATSDATYETLIKLDTEITTGEYCIFDNLNNNTTRAVDRIWYEYNGGTRRLRFEVTPSGGGTPALFYYNITLGTTNRYHIVMTINATTKGIIGYVNGVNQGSGTYSGTGSSFVNDFTIGAYYGSGLGVRFLLGRIGFFRIYNKALTADEVKELYNLSSKKYLYPFKKTLPQNLKNGLQLWLTGDSSGTTYYDLSGNSNNITATGSPTNYRIIQHKQIGLNGSSQYLSIPHTLINKSAYSVNVWCKRDSTSTEDTIFGLNGGPTAGLIYINFLNTTTTMQSYVYISGGSNTGSTVTHNVDTTKYNMYTQVFNGSTLKLYINGRLFQNIAAVGTANTPSSSNIGYGCNIDTTPTVANYFIGKTNNLMIYNKALNQIEIQQLYYSQFIS